MAHENFYTILTKQGKDLLANAMATQIPLKLTHMAVGDSNGTYYNPTEQQTALTNEVFREAVNKLSVDPNNPNYLVAEMVIPAATGGFEVREVGVYDESGALFAVGKIPASYKPNLSDGSGKDMYIRVIMEVSNASSVVLKLDPAIVLAPRAYVDDSIQAHDKDADAHDGLINAIGSHVERKDDPHQVTLPQAVAAGNTLNRSVAETYVPIPGDTVDDIDLSARNRFVRRLSADYELPVLTPPHEGEWVFHIYPDGHKLTLAQGWSFMASGTPDSSADLIRLNLMQDSVSKTLVVQNFTKEEVVQGGDNWFGDGSDGHIRITSAGAEQSQDGVVWSAIPGWLSSSDTVMAPSVEDGDMVVVNAISLTVDESMTLTTQNRCRGLLVYVQQKATINGTVSMTARGCHANPADAVATDNTPVAPSDGSPVQGDYLNIRRFAQGHTNTHIGPLMQGCGVAAVQAEANQPEVKGNGVVISIPVVGGAGASVDGDCPYHCNGADGGKKANGSGGGGSGSHSYSVTVSQGADGTCFSGGSGGAGTHNPASPIHASPYGGPGGNGNPGGNSGAGSGGAGNPGGTGGNTGESGTGGLALLIAHEIAGTGTITSKGSNGGAGAETVHSGAGSGGGVITALCATYTGEITMLATGGVSNGPSSGGVIGGNGGDGSVIGPILIDPRS